MVLVAYFSKTGNTQSVAERIAEAVSGTTHRILLKTPYPESYGATVKQAKKEIQSDFHPELVDDVAAIEDDVVFIGSPNYCSTISPPVASFLAKHDWKGKRIIPFVTHGGGGIGRAINDIKRFAPGAIVYSPHFYCYGSRSVDKELKDWAERAVE
ncbi:Flavodoxin [Carpediemonas membranifera]|uniref:Flavodoxin n=1 Tax=Carpediemonas membranifera TaxID=201153 RepID=A0A8J6BEJ1_9EUKA|nr:Flavodoxin [Carpediemonas membranifera]|eukprot:KAG9395802.1 Flavodoxin [Carpediemonas membranifera]